MSIDKKILSELERYRRINNYIMEQDAAAGAPPAEDPLAGGAALPPPPGGEMPPPPGGEPPAVPGAPPAVPGAPPAAPGGTEPQVVDTAKDPDVEKVGEKEDKEEIEVTDLVKSQKNVESKQEEYFDTLFKHLENLESKLSEMDNIVNKLNSLEQKIEKYRVRTPEEKLELRSLDSGPYTQKLSQFFDDKLPDMEKTGKNEYVLTQDEVEDYSPMEVKKSFRTWGEEPEIDNFKRIN